MPPIISMHTLQCSQRGKATLGVVVLVECAVHAALKPIWLPMSMYLQGLLLCKVRLQTCPLIETWCSALVLT